MTGLNSCLNVEIAKLAMAKKVKRNGRLFEKIPSPIIWDILSRLPTKACLMSKLVCKDWYAIITDPEFADLRRSHGCYTTALLRDKFHNGRRDFLLLDLYKHGKVDDTGNLVVNADEMIRFKFQFEIPNKQDLHPVNDCNGVILLKSSYWGPYVLCNLLTGQYIIVKEARRSWCSLSGMGLGYCHFSQRFKVLRVLECYRGVTRRYVMEIRIIGTNRWRTISNTELLDDLNWDGAIFFKDSLHIHFIKEKCILSFHFGYEKFVRIPLPGEINRYSCYSSLCILDSCLCFSTIINADRRCEIWAMKDYEVKDSWVKVAVVKHTDSPLLQMGSLEVMALIARRSGSSSGLSVVLIESAECKRKVVLGVPYSACLALNPNFSKLQKFCQK